MNINTTRRAVALLTTAAIAAAVIAAPTSSQASPQQALPQQASPQQVLPQAQDCVTGMVQDRACEHGDNALDDVAEAVMNERGITRAEAERRIGWQDRAPALGERLAKIGGDNFGGVWIHPDTDRIVVGTTGPMAVTAEIAAAGLTGVTDVVRVRHSVNQLNHVTNWLSNRLALANQGAEYTMSVGTDLATNQVVITAPEPENLTVRQQQLIAAAQLKFGSAIAVERVSASPEEVSCSQWGCPLPVRGGVVIKARGKHDLCTSGVLTRSKSDGKRYMLTAGHCMTPGKSEIWMYNVGDGTVGGPDIGRSHRRIHDIRGDMGLIALYNHIGAIPATFVGPSPTTVRDTNYGFTAVGTATRNIRVCKTGQRAGTSCGVVTRVNATVTTAGGVTMRGMVATTICAQKGDSGGPVYSGHKVYGIVSNGSGSVCNMNFQPIDAAARTLNVYVVLRR